MNSPKEHVRLFAWPLAIFACTICIHRSLTLYLKSSKTNSTTEEPFRTSRKKAAIPSCETNSPSSDDLPKVLESKFKSSTAGCVDELKNVIAIVNPRSGGQKGESLIHKLRELGIEVFNLFDFYGNRETETMERFRNLISITPRPNELLKDKRDFLILCGGGDGSISSITRLVEQASAGLTGVQTTLCPLPLGTGNDLCRSLGWGHRNPSPNKLKRKLREITNQFQNKKIIFIDKWSLSIKPKQAEGPVLPSGRKPPESMFCYASFGYDAGIALAWESSRQKKPERFTSQATNNWYYVAYGFQEYFSPSIKNISEFIKVEIDDIPVELPPKTKSLKIININSAASGVNFWGTGPSCFQQRPDDGLLEVCATTGVSHLLAIHCGVGRASRCGQGRVIKVVVLKPIPIQVDGEPWTQPPCEVVISLDKHVPFLPGPENKARKFLVNRVNLKGNPFKLQKEVTKRLKQLKI